MREPSCRAEGQGCAGGAVHGHACAYGVQPGSSVHPRRGSYDHPRSLGPRSLAFMHRARPAKPPVQRPGSLQGHRAHRDAHTGAHGRAEERSKHHDVLADCWTADGCKRAFAGAQVTMWSRSAAGVTTFDTKAIRRAYGRLLSAVGGRAVPQGQMAKQRPYPKGLARAAQTTTEHWQHAGPTSACIACPPAVPDFPPVPVGRPVRPVRLFACQCACH